MISIALSDGTVISNLELNGTNFVSKTKIDESIFDYNLSPVVITIDNDVTIHDHMKFIQQIQYGDDWYFVLLDKTEEELQNDKFQAQIDYMAMMTGVDLEDFDV